MERENVVVKDVKPVNIIDIDSLKIDEIKVENEFTSKDFMSIFLRDISLEDAKKMIVNLENASPEVITEIYDAISTNKLVKDKLYPIIKKLRPNTFRFMHINENKLYNTKLFKNADTLDTAEDNDMYLIDYLFLNKRLDKDDKLSIEPLDLTSSIDNQPYQYPYQPYDQEYDPNYSPTYLPTSPRAQQASQLKFDFTQEPESPSYLPAVQEEEEEPVQETIEVEEYPDSPVEYTSDPPKVQSSKPLESDYTGIS